MKYLIFISLYLIILSSCKKKVEPENVMICDLSNGIICMNEGLFQQNNASLSYYSVDNGTISQSVFSSINGRGLGDTANDMIYYVFNGTAYYAIAVDVSSQIEIIEASTLQSVKQVPLFQDSQPHSPRALNYYNGELFSINFDGTVSVISLIDYSVSQTISVGLNPDQAEIVGQKLYCVNSGGLNAPKYDTTISIINLDTKTVESTINTAINCSAIVKDENADLYLISRGNYIDIDPKLIRLKDNEVVQTFSIDIGSMAYYNHSIYYYDQTNKAIFKLNTITEELDPLLLIDCSHFNDFYGIYIQEKNGDIFLVDANGYVNSSKVSCFTNNGQYKYQFNAGLNTGELAFKL